MRQPGQHSRCAYTTGRTEDIDRATTTRAHPTVSRMGQSPQPLNVAPGTSGPSLQSTAPAVVDTAATVGHSADLGGHAGRPAGGLGDHGDREHGGHRASERTSLGVNYDIMSGRATASK